jgi:RecA/RadA recombinase
MPRLPFFGMAASSTIIDLRNVLAARFPQARPAPAARVATGVAALDDACGGGLPKSAITELTTPQPSGGAASLLHLLLTHAQRERSFLALVDGRDSFDPGSAGAARLRHLLWVRCTRTLDAVKAAICSCATAIFRSWCSTWC